MKILHVSQYVYNKDYPELTKNKSGLGIMVDDICSSLSQFEDIYLFTHKITCGHQSDYTILSHRWIDVIKNFKFNNLFRGIKYALRSDTGVVNRLHLVYYAIDVGCLDRIVKRIKPDLIHIHEYVPATMCFIEYCNKNGMKFIVTSHGLLAEKDCPQYIKDSERQMMQLYCEKQVPLTTISSAIKKKLIYYYDIVNPNNIHVILNGVRIKNSGSKISFIKNKVLLCVGQLSERKNQEQIIRAIKLLDESERGKIKVYFIGNDTLNGKIQQQIADAGLSNIIECIGFVDRADICKFYNEASGLIVASKDEGFGLPIVEAMTFGVPCVIFKDLDAVDDLSFPEGFILVNDRKDISLAEGIRKLISSDWNRDLIISKAQKFSLESMASQYDSLYKNGVSYEKGDK